MAGRRYPLARLDIRAFEITGYHRLIWQRYHKKPLGIEVSPSRFSDPLLQYAVLYAAQNLRCAFAEVVLRDRFVRSGAERVIGPSEITNRAVVLVAGRQSLRFVDLRDDGLLKAGAPTDARGARNHASGRALSRALYTHDLEPDGIVFQSRLTNGLVIAVFDRAIDKLEVTRVFPLDTHPEIPEVLRRYGVSVARNA